MEKFESRIVVWDVGHGSSFSIMSPNRKTAMVDLGANIETEFSPIKFTKAMWNLKDLDYLVISHPHLDHVRDIRNIQALKPQVFLGRTIPREKLIPADVEGDDKMALEYYAELRSQYSVSVEPDKSPRSTSWGDHSYFSNYFIDADWQTEPNNTSIVTFYHTGGFTLVYPGDIEQRGWEELLKNETFVKDLKSTSIFIASHHGRKAGFSQEVLEIAKPVLVIISDSRFKETSVTSYYSEAASGFKVINDNNGTSEERKVVSTRADGRVMIDIANDGSSSTGSVRVKKTSI